MKLKVLSHFNYIIEFVYLHILNMFTHENMYSFIALLSSNVIVIFKIHFSFIGFVNDVPILFVTFHFYQFSSIHAL